MVEPKFIRNCLWLFYDSHWSMQTKTTVDTLKCGLCGEEEVFVIEIKPMWWLRRWCRCRIDWVGAWRYFDLFYFDKTSSIILAKHPEPHKTTSTFGMRHSFHILVYPIATELNMWPRKSYDQTCTIEGRTPFTTEIWQFLPRQGYMFGVIVFRELIFIHIRCRKTVFDCTHFFNHGSWSWVKLMFSFTLCMLQE